MASKDFQFTDPDWRAYQERSGPAAPAPSAPAAPGAPAGAPAAAAPAVAAPAAAAPAAFGSVTANMPAGGYTDVFNLAATKGMGDVLNAPSYIAGGLRSYGADVPNVPRTVDTGLTPEQSKALENYPWTAMAGRIVGQTIGTAPAIVAPEVLGAAGVAPAAMGVAARAMANPVVQGAVTNLLTGAESPDESLLHRAIMGGIFGKIGGAIGDKVGGWFGAGKTIPQSSQEAGQLLQNAGIDLTEHNVPGASGGFVSTKTTGAPPSEQQAAQIAQAVTKPFTPAGQPGVTDLGATNLNTLLNNKGSQITAAANSGGIDLAKAPGLVSDLQNVITASRDPVNMLSDAEQRAIAAQTGRIAAAIQAGGGKLSGSQFDSLVGAKSPISSWLDPTPRALQSDGMTTVAEQLDEALRNAFQQSSPPGVYSDWVNHRTDYRLLKGIEGAIDPNGDLNPTTLWTNIQKKFPDLKRIGGGSGPDQVAEMAQLAAALRTAFGGTPPNVSQAAAGGTVKDWLARHPYLPFAAAGAAYTAPGVVNMLTSPAATLGQASAYGLAHLPVLGAMAPVAAAGMLARWAGQQYQKSAYALPNLLRTGQSGMPLVNALTPYAPSAMTIAPPSNQNAPAR